MGLLFSENVVPLDAYCNSGHITFSVYSNSRQIKTKRGNQASSFPKIDENVSKNKEVKLTSCGKNIPASYCLLLPVYINNKDRGILLPAGLGFAFLLVGNLPYNNLSRN